MADAANARIALLLPDLRPGGAERVNLGLAEEFVARRIPVDIVVGRAQGELVSEAERHCRIIDLQAQRLREMVRPLARYLEEVRPAAVLASMWPLTAIASFCNVVTGSKARLVLVEHTTLSHSAGLGWHGKLINRVFGRIVYGFADAVVTVSGGVRADLVKRTNLTRQVSVIHNPLRYLNLTGEADGDLLSWWGAETASVLSVGSLKAAKDYPTLLRSFRRFSESNSARLMIIGEGDLRGELETLIASLGLSERVRLAGFVADPGPYFARANLFVLSSAWEGFGNVIIEALAAGVPVVSTDCPSGPAEILENGKYGRLVPVGDPEALAAAMAEALDAEHDRDMLRARGAEFSVERAADQYLALLDPGGKLLAASR